MRTKSRPQPTRAPADFDEVKRRFVRQNRELARNNSNQGLRIRSLELEVSRLLDENLELRGEVSRLGREVCVARRRGRGAGLEAVSRVKGELERKLKELGGLVEGIAIGDVDGEDEEDGVGDGLGKRGSFEAREWRQRQPLSELMAESQMPTIEEDGAFPRQSLEVEQVKAVRLSDHGSNESPDLGPPPVAHFDVEGDPIKFDARRTAPTNGEEELPASLSVNLETRKKRKDGQPKLELRRSSILPQSPNKNESNEPAPTLRTGAKRKLSDRDTEKAIKPPSKGDFTFSRKATTEASKTAAELTQEESRPAVVAPASPASKPGRRVLGDKSVNQSPRKAPPAATETGKPDKDDAKDTTTQKQDPAKPVRPTTRKRRVSSIPAPSSSPTANRILPTVEFAPPSEPDPIPTDAHPPKTPAPEPLFSPTPSEPSARQRETRGDTPPPSDLSTLSNFTTATNEGVRPSRRARSAVNYAEPSLNTKMRRPDKKMVDALSGLHQQQQREREREQEKLKSVTVIAEKSIVAEEEKGDEKTEAVVVKAEPVEDDEDDSAWKSLPTSHEAAAAPASPCGQKVAETKEKEVREDMGDTIATTVVKASRKRRQSSQLPLAATATTGATSSPETDLAAKMRELDVYDFKDGGSSSPTAVAEQGTKPVVKARCAGAQRRHSAVPASRAGGAKGGVVVGRESEGADARGEGGVAATPGEGEVAAAAATGGRAERAASRRRSMML